MTATAVSASTPPRARVRPRVAWIAGTRGEIMLLGPLFQHYDRRSRHNSRPGEPISWFFTSGEHGMAAYQALDRLGLVPEEAAELCHPADEPAVRLNLMIARTEAFIRQRKATHVVFAGFGPTAAGAAIYCHARGCPGLWLRPPDPAGLVPRLRWESGLVRLIEACAPCVKPLEWMAAFPPAAAGEGPADLAPIERAPETDMMSEKPLALVAILRRDWGMTDDTTARLARALAAWAAASPGAEWRVITNLNARMEGPLRSMHAPPPNLSLAPPLPYPEYGALIERAALVLTDSPLVAAEALEMGRPLLTMADRETDFAGADAPAPGAHYAFVPGDLSEKQLGNYIANRLAGTPTSPSRHRPAAAAPVSIIEKIEGFLA